MAWEVAMAYFGVRSLCDVVTKRYGYHEGLPTQDHKFLMSKEVSKLIEDQDTLFLRKQVHNESYQGDPIEVYHVEYLDETFDEDEFFLPHFPPGVVSIKKNSF